MAAVLRPPARAGGLTGWDDPGRGRRPHDGGRGPTVRAMTPPAAVARHARPVDPAPRAALAAGVLAGIGALVLLAVAFLVLALGGLSSGGADRAWALLPLAAGLAGALGGVRLLRRRGWGAVAVAVACLLTAAFVVLLVAQARDLGEDPTVGLSLLLLAGPVAALGLALTPPVRRWLATAP